MPYMWFRHRLQGLSPNATYRIMRGEHDAGPGADGDDVDYRKSPQDIEAELMREF